MSTSPGHYINQKASKLVKRTDNFKLYSYRRWYPNVFMELHPTDIY